MPDSTELPCKLTNQEMRTHGQHQWILNEWCETDGVDELCGPGWLHAYTHPLLAVLLNPIHANLSDPRLFVIETGGTRKDDRGLKVGFTKMRLAREMPLPAVTREHRVAFGILCALEVYNVPEFVSWAQAWLSGENRSRSAARSAESAARSAESAAESAARSAVSAAWSAAESAAWSAAWSAAESAAWSAESAAWSATAAAPDLIALAKRALMV